MAHKCKASLSASSSKLYKEANAKGDNFKDSPLSRFGNWLSTNTTEKNDAALKEVKEAVATQNSIVIVGMQYNPFCSKAVSVLKKANFEAKYVGIGGYFSKYSERQAVKVWSGWPLIPIVFVKGEVVGGFTEINNMIKSGELANLLK
ncbi:hypothetical protein ScalyP_jg7591 [Parmales sp. scaly parma]|mgnify:CR=1 FL=1|nr:hypothetical protein ScalyP_jg7591 [Parmales sp. scaly parma]|tara:strand:- start:57 stop:497 length:441 start_codon:yes stop_codon:yes gene_type:complete